MFAGALFAGLPTVGTGASIEYLGGHTLVLVEGRANEIMVPHIRANGVDTRLMEWDIATTQFVSSVNPTRISEFCHQLNQRYLGLTLLSPAVIERAEAIDADTGNRLVFTPGSTPAGSLQDFEVIIQDQDGDFESRGFVLFLAPNANPGGLDGGEVWLRLSPIALPW